MSSPEEGRRARGTETLSASSAAANLDVNLAFSASYVERSERMKGQERIVSTYEGWIPAIASKWEIPSVVINTLYPQQAPTEPSFTPPFLSSSATLAVGAD